MSELVDPSHIGRDAKLIGRAIKAGWPIRQEIVDSLPDLMHSIAEDGEESVRDRVAAAKVLVAMKAANDKQARPKQRGRPTQQTTVVMMDGNIDDAKRELLSRIGQRCEDTGGTG